MQIRGELNREIREKNTDAKKYEMLFNHGKNPENREEMQRQMRVNYISSCSSSPSCPKILESSLRNTGNFRQDREDEQDWMQNAKYFFPVSLHFILITLSILPKDSPLTFQRDLFEFGTSC